MSRWIPSTDRAEWGRLHRSYKSSSFRLEAQQTYSNPGENAWLVDFLAGRPLEGRKAAEPDRVAQVARILVRRVRSRPKPERPAEHLRLREGRVSVSEGWPHRLRGTAHL